MHNHYRFINIIFLSLVFCIGLVQLCNATTYPDMPGIVEPTTNYPAGFAPFNPPIDSGLIKDANSPQIAEWTRQNQPGDTMALTAENLDPNSARFVVYGGGITDSCDIPLIDGRQCSVTLPATLPPNTMYLMWPHNGNGFGEPVPINQTEAWWVGFNEVSQGDTFYVYGRNLKLGGGECHLYIKELDRWLTSSNANPYRAPFVMPGDVPPGAYTIYAHNGHGKVCGWAKPLSIIVKTPYAWTGNQYNLVTDFGANGSDQSDDQAAFNAMSAAVSANPGSTVTIPAGTYYLSGFFDVKHNTRYMGAGMGQTVIKPLPTRGTGDYLRSGSNYELKGMSFVADETVVCDFAFKFSEAWAHDALLENVEFIDTREEDYGVHGFLTLNKSTRMTLRGCRVITYHSILVGQASYLRLDSCEFNGCHDNNQMITMGGGEYNEVVGCTAKNYDMSDASEGFGWAKGRWIVVPSRFSNIYIGNNHTDRIQPREPTPFVSNLTVSSIGAFGNVQSYWYGTFGEQTIHFSSDIPDELHGRGNDTIPWQGAMAILIADGGTYIREYRVRTLDALNNTLTIQVATPLPTDHTWESVQIKDIVDGNAGEQILFEGPQPRQAGYVTGATDSSVFVSSSEASGGSGSTELFITGGRGLGQAREIASINGGSGEIVVSEPWNVVPDQTSTYSMGIGSGNVIIYDNDFSGRPSGIGYDHKATTALQANNAYNVIFANNTMTNVRQGVRLYGYMSEMSTLAGKSAPAPNFFFTCLDNEINGAANGFLVDVFRSGSNPLVPGDSWCLGHVFRGNRLSNITLESAFHFRDGYDTDEVIGVNVIDGNQVFNLGSVTDSAGRIYRATVLTLDTNAKDQVLVGNNFSGNPNITGLNNNNVVLRGNTWSDFGQTYATSFSRLSIPQPISSGDAVDLWNTGTATLNWTSPTLGGGVILPEQSVNLTGITEGTHTITAGSQTLQIQIIAATQSMGPHRIDYPVSGFGGISISAELVDQDTGSSQSLGPWIGPTNIALEGLASRWYLLVIKQYDAGTGTWVPITTNSIGQSSFMH